LPREPTATPQRKGRGMDRAPTVIEAVKMSEGYLRRHGVESPRLNAEHLLAGALGCTRLDLYLRFEEILAESVLGAYRESLRKRARRVPLQYILGEVEFRSRRFVLEEGVFIPRPETELLVDLAEELMGGRREARFLELGVGCGAVSGALAAGNPGWTGAAFDISAAAAALASRNLEMLGAAGRVGVFAAGSFDAVSPGIPFDLIISNPPYIPTGDIEGLQDEVSMWESQAALDGGIEGIDFYPMIAAAGMRILTPGGAVAVEIGHGQGEAVARILNEAGYEGVETRKDYNGLERLAAGRRP
jgi:release factor glutamine methyltransferase